MTMRTLLAYMTVIVFFAASAIPAAGQEKVDAKALFETKCSTCHKTDKATSQKKTPKEWQATVTRMKDVRKAPVNDEDAAIITKYLSENYGKEAKR
jgi:mono/diheme cytochrome c family protein